MYDYDVKQYCYSLVRYMVVIPLALLAGWIGPGQVASLAQQHVWVTEACWRCRHLLADAFNQYVAIVAACI